MAAIGPAHAVSLAKRLVEATDVRLVAPFDDTAEIIEGPAPCLEALMILAQGWQVKPAPAGAVIVPADLQDSLLSRARALYSEVEAERTGTRTLILAMSMTIADEWESDWEHEVLQLLQVWLDRAAAHLPAPGMQPLSEMSAARLATLAAKVGIGDEDPLDKLLTAVEHAARQVHDRLEPQAFSPGAARRGTKRNHPASPNSGAGAPKLAKTVPYRDLVGAADNPSDGSSGVLVTLGSCAERVTFRQAQQQLAEAATVLSALFQRHEPAVVALVQQLILSPQVSSATGTCISLLYDNTAALRAGTSGAPAATFRQSTLLPVNWRPRPRVRAPLEFSTVVRSINHEDSLTDQALPALHLEHATTPCWLLDARGVVQCTRNDIALESAGAEAHTALLALAPSLAAGIDASKTTRLAPDFPEFVYGRDALPTFSLAAARGAAAELLQALSTRAAERKIAASKISEALSLWLILETGIANVASHAAAFLAALHIDDRPEAHAALWSTWRHDVVCNALLRTSVRPDQDPQFSRDVIARLQGLGDGQHQPFGGAHVNTGPTAAHTNAPPATPRPATQRDSSRGPAPLGLPLPPSQLQEAHCAFCYHTNHSTADCGALAAAARRGGGAVVLQAAYRMHLDAAQRGMPGYAPRQPGDAPAPPGAVFHSMEAFQAHVLSRPASASTRGRGAPRTAARARRADPQPAASPSMLGPRPAWNLRQSSGAPPFR